VGGKGNNLLLLTNSLSLIIMNQNVLIHCKPEYLPEIKRLGLDYNISSINEVDVKVPDREYSIENGYYPDPDEQLCEHYGIDYDQVNCIEAI
tara:strand:+ start:1554 stop:1829 length:276 start_codon:yes stop_codon:yes gene_type:complete